MDHHLFFGSMSVFGDRYVCQLFPSVEYKASLTNIAEKKLQKNLDKEGGLVIQYYTVLQWRILPFLR